MSKESHQNLVRELVNAWKDVKAKGGHTLVLDEVSSSWLTRAQESLEEVRLSDLQVGDIADGDNECVVYSASEAFTGDGAAYWSNESGWVGFESATRFDRSEMQGMHLPVSVASDAKWISVDQALNLVTAERTPQYISSSGTQCPSCQNQGVAGHSVEIDGGQALQDCNCTVCDASWTDYYVLKGFSELDIPIQPINA